MKIWKVSFFCEKVNLTAQALFPCFLLMSLGASIIEIQSQERVLTSFEPQRKLIKLGEKTKFRTRQDSNLQSSAP